jgi:Flp pilus assembly pilin Flp
MRLQLLKQTEPARCGRIKAGAHPLMTREYLQALKNERGQAMVEYVIVVVAVLAGVLAVNALLVPPMNELYKFITDVVSLPIP